MYDLVLPSFFFTNRIGEVHGEVEGHITPWVWSLARTIQSSSTNAISRQWDGCFMGFTSPVSTVCSTRFVLPRSFSFWENTPWCLRSSQWITLFSSPVLLSILPSYHPVRYSGSGAKGILNLLGEWTLCPLCHPSSFIWQCRSIYQQHPSCCWEIIPLIRVLLSWDGTHHLNWLYFSHHGILSNDHQITVQIKYSRLAVLCQWLHPPSRGT